MEKQKLMDELDELLNIPQFERIIYHKVEELKTFLRDEISLYQSLKKDFRKAAYGDMQVWDGGEHPRIQTQTYRFQLDRDDENRWVPTDIEPHLPPGYDVYDIIPMEIIDHISGFKPNPTKIETVNQLVLPQLKGRAFNLRFAVYSDFHAMGTITEIKKPRERTVSDEEGDNLVDISDYYKKDALELNYKELMYYMEKFPAFKEHVFSEFFMRWKPLIDVQLLPLP
jgi:hypothetical protein